MIRISDPASGNLKSLKGLKGQVATEFMLYTAVFMFMAVASFIVVSDLQSTEVPLQQNTVVKETGEGFVSVITLAVKAGKGFSYNYTFPKTLFTKHYMVNMKQINDANNSIMISWEGEYGNFSYQYDVPSYNYKLEGSCLAASSQKPDDTVDSSYCSNVLMLKNDGENLTITQLP